MIKAKGTFVVDLTPAAPEQKRDGVSLGRMLIDKKFIGDLEGHSVGEMLSAMTAVSGSAGYVAIEHVSGVLHGQRGTFVLQHNGIMGPGRQALSIAVVPDSATGDLEGLAGEMVINIEDGKHYYEFDYVLAP